MMSPSLIIIGNWFAVAFRAPSDHPTTNIRAFGLEVLFWKVLARKDLVLRRVHCDLTSLY